MSPPGGAGQAPAPYAALFVAAVSGLSPLGVRMSDGVPSGVTPWISAPPCGPTRRLVRCGAMKTFIRAIALSVPALLTAAAFPQTPPARVAPMTPDVMDKYEQVLPSADFVRRDAMIPMRDGVKLYTTLVMKKGTTNAPILLSRSPYDAHHSTH